MRTLLYRFLYWLCMKLTKEPEMIVLPLDAEGDPVLHDDIAGKFRVFIVQFQRPVSLKKFIMRHESEEFQGAKYKTHDELWWPDK